MKSKFYFFTLIFFLISSSINAKPRCDIFYEKIKNNYDILSLDNERISEERTMGFDIQVKFDKFLGILKAYESPRLFLIYKMTQLLGSALLAVLVEKNLVNEKKAWMLSRIEEDWQEKIWGKDEESIEAEKNKRKDFKLLNLCLRHLVEY